MVHNVQVHQVHNGEDNLIIAGQRVICSAIMYLHRCCFRTGYPVAGSIAWWVFAIERAVVVQWRAERSLRALLCKCREGFRASVPFLALRTETQEDPTGWYPVGSFAVWARHQGATTHEPAPCVDQSVLAQAVMAVITGHQLQLCHLRRPVVGGWKRRARRICECRVQTVGALHGCECGQSSMTATCCVVFRHTD